ncbi:MAG TPA: hypothetical protein VM686_28265 [Polyangiaceae bacterium]|nr:hypothetical protein [Polyangiaceae bacterium]
MILRRLRPVLLASMLATLACGGGQQKSADAPSGPAQKPKTFRDVLAEVREREAKNGQAGAGNFDEPESGDSHEAVLTRLLNAPWGARVDKDDQVLAPLVDWEKWRRVRFWGFEHLTGFRYGKDHHAMTVAFVTELPAGTAVRSETCMRKFEAWGRPQIKGFDVKFDEFKVKWTKWRNQPLMISYVDGKLNWGLSRVEFSAAWAAYPAYPNACLIYAVGVPWREHEALAQKLRDRWVDEGFAQVQAKTSETPFRK